MKTRNLIKLAVTWLAAVFVSLSTQAGIVFTDNFETYPVQNPAPNPLTNGPAGGQWWFVDPTPPTIAANEHRIYNSGTGGSGLQSRCWISSINNCTITNAISIPALPAGTNVFVFTVSFLAATDTTAAGRTATFRYEIGSSSGGLGFISGGNADFTQAFTDLTGYGIAEVGAKGKTDDRKFNVQFFATNLTTADKIFVSLTRVTNAGTSGAFIAIDDVRIGINFGAPEFVEQPESVAAIAGDTVVFSAVVTNFPDVYQWTRNGELIPGATTDTYTIPFVTKPDEGTFVLWATNSEGFTGSSPAILTVTDVTPPTITQATGVLTLEHAQVRFSEPVDAESATNATYAVNNGVAVSAARLADPFTVEVTTTSLAPNTAYSITVSNVKDLANNTIAPGSSANFTTPALVISPVRYDAGTTTTKPAGPDDPVSAAGGYWAQTVNTNVGITASPVLDDLGTGFNAWNISDQNVAAGTGVLDYRMPIDQPSDDLARTNGWRLVVRSRMITDFFGGGASPVVLYSDIGSNRRYGFYLDLDASQNLVASFLGGSTYTLTFDSLSYHTHVLIFDPATGNVSYYFDGQFITSSYTGQTAGTTYNGLAFGTGSSTGSGEMNFNLVQLDVVGGTPPVLVSAPEDSTNGVGQKATFTAQFTPFVGAYQWLSNGVIVPGATSNTITTEFLTLAMDGQKFRCRALHALGNVESPEATLTVTSDTNPPTVVAAEASLLLDRVAITFSEPVLPLYATNISNYSWVNPGVANVSAQMLDPLTVELRTTPLEPGSNYTVRVSNIRDTSNLVIANNTPANFKTAKLQVLARYDAGTTTTRPAGPPEPGSAEGGFWVVNIGSDPGLMTNAVIDDFGTGYHAWQVTDQTTTTGQFIQYNMPFSPEQQAGMRANGWVMSVRSRFVDDFGSEICVMCQAGDQLGNRNLLWFDFANGEFYVRPQGAADQVVTPGGVGVFDYHLLQVVFNPTTTNADFYVDGERRVSGWAGDVSGNTYPGVQWGTGSSLNQGSMNVNLVEFKLVEPPVQPSVAVALNGSNVEVQYIGILEAASALGGEWSPVATNATATAVLYSVPASGQPQQFFRARVAE